MFQKDSYQDSFTLDNYVFASKKQNLDKKKNQKQIQSKKRQRKYSNQLSLFSWLTKDKLNQKSPITSLDKYLILKIFGYLRLSQVVLSSQVCNYFLSCYRSLWTDKQYFCQVETDKFTSQQLVKIIEKSSKLEHINQLKHFYEGKNLYVSREKFKIKIGGGNRTNHGMLEVFSVRPKHNRQGSTFILDAHLNQIINSSYRSLKIVQLVKCSFLRQFSNLRKCQELIKLQVTYNQYLTTEHIKIISQNCHNIEILYLEQCSALDENIFIEISKMHKLHSLILKNFKQNFNKLKRCEDNKHLKYLDLEGSLITDEEAFGLLKFKQLLCLSIKNCQLLTDDFADYLHQKIEGTNLKIVNFDKNNFKEDQKEKLLKFFNSK